MTAFISEERLSVYTQHLKIKKHQVQRAYHWNKALSGALLPALQCLEVTLRNALDQGIQNNPPPASVGLYATNSDWINSLPEYMGNKSLKNKVRYKKIFNPKSYQKVDAQNYLLDSSNNRVIAKRIYEESKVISAKNRLRKVSKTPTPARIISSMDFGFWTNFLSISYEDLSSKALLWPNLLSCIFPNAPSHVTRADIEIEFVRIKELRNRLSHHEAIWKFYYAHPHSVGLSDYNAPIYGAQASCSLLRKHYDDILKLIGWMDIDRKNNFIKNNANLRFDALCSIDGLNSYISPESINNKVAISKGGVALKKILSCLDKNEFVQITRKGDPILTLSFDCMTKPII